MLYENYKGFSLLEAMLTIVVFATIAGLAIPSYVTQMKRIRNQEAITILSSLHDQQKDYHRRNGSYIDGMTTESTVQSALDITIPTMQGFQNLQLHGSSTVSCTGGAVTRLATVTDKGSEYYLIVLEDGRIVCQDVTLSDCSSSVCVKMGFNANW